MYFDAVLRENGIDVVFNGTPQEVVEFLKSQKEEDRQNWWVCRGESLKYYTPNDYFKWMRVE